jgi:SAM-dependent methyltransferase
MLPVNPAVARSLWRRVQEFLVDRAPIRIQLVRPGSSFVVSRPDRLCYQERSINFDLQPGQRVLDIGSGGYPFPYATVLVDRFPGATEHRFEPLVKGAKPVVVADIASLPFRDQYFDYIYCSHVLEHATDPIFACREIMRVGKRGYIETPTLAKDMLFAWAKGMHKWHVIGIGSTLCFFEYSARQLEGIRSSAWTDVIFSRWRHPLQAAFDDNQDLFNVMFTWNGQFAVIAFHLDGRVDSLNAPGQETNQLMWHAADV